MKIWIPLAWIALTSGPAAAHEYGDCDTEWDAWTDEYLAFLDQLVEEDERDADEALRQVRGQLTDAEAADAYTRRSELRVEMFEIMSRGSDVMRCMEGLGP